MKTNICSACGKEFEVENNGDNCSPCCNVDGLYVVISHKFPPIPTRNFDWATWVDGTEDADWQGEESGWVAAENFLVGHGATQEEAILDLIERVAERAA